MADLEALSDELARQFTDAVTPKLRVGDLPILTTRVREELGESLTDETASTLVRAAFALALDADERPDGEPLGALEGAQAYFLLGRPPTREERAAIREANRPRSAPNGSQPYRFSWARWQQLRIERQREDVKTPQERSGRDRRAVYAAATVRAVGDALERPADLRAALRLLDESVTWSPGVASLLAASELYARESAIDPELHIERTLEQALVDDVRDPAHPWQRAIVGEAGAGKSTLLWSLRRRFAESDDALPILVGASWLIDYLDRNEPQSLIDLLLEIRTADRQPILLVDTVDLMLHDDATRQPLLRLMHALAGAGIVGIYSSRPQEAALLTHDDLRRIDLAPYDDAELAAAVTALVERYCPGASVSGVLEAVRKAQARGLPVVNVCRSPLLLRMLFDLASPAEPELTDMDVTRLFAAYWERRLVRDARSEADVRQRTRSTTDLSPLAGRVGIGLLAAGLPELAEPALRDVVTTAGTNAQRVGEGIDILLERGVLERAAGRMGFFHQTMFEFAAARGLLARGNPTALTLLARRTADSGGDLFVGSVLEQTLILAGDNPLMLAAAVEAIEALIEPELAVLDSIALAAWAHHPSLLDTSGDRLRGMAAAASERAARLIPAIAGKEPGEAVSQLLLLWRGRLVPSVAVAVLEGLARLALRSPEVVAQAMEYLDPVDTLVREQATLEVWRSLHGLLRALAGTAPSLVRATLVAALTRTDIGRRTLELENLADSWLSIGDEHLLAEVLRAVEADTSEDVLPAPALGRIIAREWERAGDPEAASRTVDDLESSRATGVLRLIDSARYSAVGATLVASSDEGSTAILQRLLQTRDRAARDWIAIQVMHDLLSAEDPKSGVARRVFRNELATAGADAQRDRLTPSQTLILRVLAQSQLPPGLVAQLLPNHLEHDDWMASPHLLALAPLAAEEGHRSARQLLTHIAHDPARVSPATIDALFSGFGARRVQDEQTHDHMLTIALQTDRVRDLTALIAAMPRFSAQTSARARALLDYSFSLIDGPSEARRAHGTSVLASLMAQTAVSLDWPQLRSWLESITDPALLVPPIKNLWQQTPEGDVRPQLEFLGRYIRIDPSAARPISRVDGVPVQIAVAAAEAYLRILGLRATWEPEAWPIIRALTLYELESDEIHVVGTRFVIACDYLQRTGAAQPRDAARQLLELLEGVAEGDFVGFDRILWHRELRGAIQYAIAGNGVHVIPSLVALCRRLDDVDLVEVIARTLAETDYARAREHLHRLIPETRYDLSRVVLDIVRTHDRSFGTRAFPEIAFVAG